MTVTVGTFRAILAERNWPKVVRVSQGVFWLLHDSIPPSSRQRYYERESGDISLQFDISRVVSRITDGDRPEMVEIADAEILR